MLIELAALIAVVRQGPLSLACYRLLAKAQQQQYGKAQSRSAGMED